MELLCLPEIIILPPEVCIVLSEIEIIDLQRKGYNFGVFIIRININILKFLFYNSG